MDGLDYHLSQTSTGKTAFICYKTKKMIKCKFEKRLKKNKT